MLTTFQDIYEAVQSDMNVLDEAPLFPLATIKDAVNRSYVKCHSIYKWPGKEWAKKTSTQANIEYYDYPSDFEDDSIWRIEVDDEQYGEDPDGSPTRFEDYLIWRRDSANANSTDKKWSTQKRRFFIYPVPTAVGSYNITVWGRKVPPALSGDSDTTIFSNSMPVGNEAVVMEAEAILRAKGEEEKSSLFRSQEAKQILVTAWDKIRKEQDKYEKLEPFFEVTDMFGKQNTKENIIGNF